MKQGLEDDHVMAYSWTLGEEIVADILTKQGSRLEVLDDILVWNEFRHAQTEDNLVMYIEDEFKMRNLVTKKGKEAERKDASKI